MNALAPWKVVLTVIAIFGAGVLTGGFLTNRTIKDAIRRSEEPRKSFTLTTDRMSAPPAVTPDGWTITAYRWINLHAADRA